ncbi:unnamed protein product [Calypogeia fissa]
MGMTPPSIDVALAKLRSVVDEKLQQQGLIKRVALYLVPPSGAALTFGGTLVAAQAAGAAAGISCATPVLASLMGCMALCGASAASAQVSHSLRRLCQEHDGTKSFPDFGKISRKSVQENLLSREKFLINAVFGMIAFKALGGSFRNLMPSNVVNPGALARGSIPARGPKYANEVEHGLIQDLYRKHGCHHCGKRGGDSIADHMPPNVIAHGRGWAGNGSQSEAPSFFKRVASTLPLPGMPSKVVRQRLYPQCTDCMKIQSTALRHGKKALVFHFRRGMPEAPFFTGFCIGAMNLNGLLPGIDDHPGKQ